MNRGLSLSVLNLSVLSLRLSRLMLLGFVWLGLNLASAQTTLDAYTQAKTALEESITASSSDSVASLDALRRAKRAFTPLGEALGGPLNQGLQVTFGRAEQAIINASSADLKVQAAVLFGGFQRSLYEAALTAAQNGNAAQAVSLLNVLGQDLELTPAQFATPETGDPRAGDTSARALQLTFENRLAARSLAQLQTLRATPQNAATRDARYELLAGLYSHVFLIQDSPRLPATTQVTVLDAIQALIAREPLAPSLATLRTQLQTFRQASSSARQQLTPAGESTPPATVSEAVDSPRQAQTQEPAQEAENPTTSPSPADEAQTATEPENTLREARTTSATENEAEAQPSTAIPPAEQATIAEEPAAPTRDPSATASTPETVSATPDRQAAAPAASALPSSSAAQTAATSDTAPPALPYDDLFGFLTEPVRTYLLIAAGLLALGGIVLLLARVRTSLALTIATVLLLLPVLAEGLIALGTVLAPLVGMAVLAQGERYSLFVNPLTQTLWTLLAIGAGLFLFFIRRTASSRPSAGQPKPEATPTPPPPRAPLSSAGSFNWDEDF